MQKKLIIILVGIFLIMVLFGCQAQEEIPLERIKQDVEFLCNDECNGRLPGTAGNEHARDYIEKAFEEAGLIPLEGFDSLLIPYEQTVFDMEHQKQILEAVFPNGNVKTFQAGTDFFPLQNQAVKDGFSGEVTIDSTDPELTDKVYLAQSGIAVSIDAAGVVMETDKGSALIMNVYSTPVLNCNSKLFEQLEGCSSLSLEGETAFQNEMVDNVVGVLPCEGGNAEGALLITAHFDHVGGYGDTIYRGALDNASGVSLMLEVMRQLTDVGNITKHDIVFIAFNGEDMNLLGSKDLSSRLPYATVNVINLDCVGYKEEPTLGVVGENKELQAAVIAALDDELSCVSYDDAPSSDHNSFEERGIPAITVSNYFGEIDIGDIIHQTTDVPSILDFKSIAAMVNPICQYALTGELIQPKHQDQEQGENIMKRDWVEIYAKAREEIDAVGLSRDQVLPIQLDGDVFFARDINFFADVDTAEELISPVKFPEVLGSFQLVRSASLHGSYIMDDDRDKYHVMVRMAGPDDMNYEIGVPQKITNEYDEIHNWHLRYTDGNIFLTLTAFDKELTDIENVLSGGEFDEIWTESGMLYQRFYTWEENRILQAVCYVEDNLPYYYILYNSYDNSTAVNSDVILQMMIDIIPRLQEIPKLS